MTVHWAFKQLGIEPTSESGEIRRAYARLLKTMDVDADVDGYARLRHARDAALAYARGAFEPQAEEELDEEALIAANTPGEPDQADAVEAASEISQPSDEIALAQQRVIAILFPGGEQMYHLTAEETQELLRCFETLKTDPRLQQIDIVASASDWFAQVIAQSLPRSDPLVRPVADYFHWNRDQQVGVHPAVAAVIARANALDWRDRLRQRSHRLHRAWKELTKPAHENSKRGWVSTRRIRELLQEVRTRHPSLEGDMDWYRVNMWETGAHSRLSWGTGVFLFIFLIQVISFAARNAPSTGPTPPVDPTESVFSAPLTDPQKDISEVLGTLADGSIDAAKLQSRNPKLYAELRSDWQRWKETNGKREQFVPYERNLVTDLLDRGWVHAPYAILRDKMRADIQIARTLQPQACADFLAGRLPWDSLNQDQQALRRRVSAELLLTTDPGRPGPAPKPLYNYMIPGSIIEAANKKSGLSAAQFSAALRYKPPPELPASTICSARMALREAILAQPERTGFAVMRDMQD